MSPTKQKKIASPSAMGWVPECFAVVECTWLLNARGRLNRTVARRGFTVTTANYIESLIG